MTAPIPVPVDVAEPLHLIVEHRGRIVMRTALFPAGAGPVDVVSLQAHVIFQPAETHLVDLRSTAEEIAAWVAGDGTDAQRLALADGIREGWQHRLPRYADALQARAGVLEDEASAARDRLDALISEGGEPSPDPARWASAVGEAVHEIQTRHGAGLFDDGRPAPLTNARVRQRIMPSDYIPVLAEDVAGAAARIADLEHQLARTQARLAEELARRARREPA